jgi:gamma-glutamyltranspeptidase / glutathione hydrolase
VGRAGSGADAAALRAEGHTRMPFRDDVRVVTVPGCVDGWVALHARYGRLPLTDVLAPAIEFALEGFPVTPLLAVTLPRVADVESGGELPPEAPVGSVLRRPRLGRALQEIAVDGRGAWYGGDFGAGLVRLGQGLFTPEDLERSCAEWSTTLALDVDGWTLHGTPAPSSSYLALTGAAVAARLGAFGADPDDPRTAHLLVESARVMGHDRRPRLHDGASAEALLEPADLDRRAALVSDRRVSELHVPGAPGGTIFLVAVDDDGMAVSLGNSNAAGFGSHLAVPEVGVFLQNRGIGFSLVPGSPDELRPGVRPPHTLAPLLVTGGDGDCTHVLGSMGGDSQPQVLLQLLARLRHGASPGEAVDGPRWALAGREGNGFDTWDGDPGAASTQVVRHEPGAAFAAGLAERGHRIEAAAWGSAFGHAHVVSLLDGSLAAASDPRALTGSAAVC